MSYLNYSYFDLKTEKEYTQEDVDKVDNLFKEKLSKTKHKDWFIEAVFNEGFDLDKGKIRVGGESDNIKHSYEREFGECLKLLVDSFRELGYKLEVPDYEDSPYWEMDNGPDENYVIRYGLSVNNISEMEDDWKEGDDDYEAVYIDYEGEEEEGNGYDEEDDWFLD